MRNGEELHALPLPQLLKRLSDETTALVKDEFALAKAEIGEKVAPVRASAGMIGAAALLAIGAFGALTATLILALATALEPWLAALIVTLVYGVVAVVLALGAKRTLQKARPLSLDRTAQTVKEDIAWAKTRTKSGAE
jgi:hypothetical protein